PVQPTVAGTLRVPSALATAATFPTGVSGEGQTHFLTVPSIYRSCQSRGLPAPDSLPLDWAQRRSWAQRHSERRHPLRSVQCLCQTGGSRSIFATKSAVTVLSSLPIDERISTIAATRLFDRGIYKLRHQHIP